jgi:hypothetical protein
MTDDADTTEMKPREYLLMDADLAAASGLPRAPHGVFCCERRPDGEHITLATTDVEYLKMAVAFSRSEINDTVKMPPAVFSAWRTGWPNEWAPTDEQRWEALS